MTFPKEYRAKLHSTNPIERLNSEIKRRTGVVRIFPNEAAITRLVGAILMEQSDEWAVKRARYMTGSNCRKSVVIIATPRGGTRSHPRYAPRLLIQQ